MRREMPDLDWDDDDVTTPLPRGRAGARILVVDDDEAMREMVASRLSREGYDVRDAVSGNDLFDVLQTIALDAWPLDGVDLIVLDNRMPGISGTETIRWLRRARWTVPALLMTAFPDAEVRREAAALGLPILAKPFGLAELGDAVTRALVGRPDAPVLG